MLFYATITGLKITLVCGLELYLFWVGEAYEIICVFNGIIYMFVCHGACIIA